MDMNLSKLWEIVKDRCAIVQGVTKNQTQLSNWTTTAICSVLYAKLKNDWVGQEHYINMRKGMIVD